MLLQTVRSVTDSWVALLGIDSYLIRSVWGYLVILDTIGDGSRHQEYLSSNGAILASTFNIVNELINSNSFYKYWKTIPPSRDPKALPTSYAEENHPGFYPRRQT